MAANITITVLSNNPQIVEVPGSGIYSEIINALGASTAAADTGTYTSQLATITGVKGGAFKASLSGTTATLTALYALGTNAVQLEVFGRKVLN